MATTAGGAGTGPEPGTGTGTGSHAVPVTGKPGELEDGLNRLFYHPLSRRLARALCPTPVTPNMVSVIGGLLIAGAGAAYVGLGWPLGVAVGLMLHLLWHVVDGADGDLARMTGRASPTGELVDGLCDYGGHVALYVTLGMALDDRIGGWAWVLAVGAGASRIVQSNHAESGRRTYLHWAYGVPWLRSSAAAPRSGIARVFGSLGTLYVQVAALTSPATERANAVVEAAERDGRQRPLRRFVRVAARRTLPLQSALGPNWRTLLLGASMALGSPAWFFAAEITALNLVLALSIARQERMARRLIARFRGDGSGALPKLS